MTTPLSELEAAALSVLNNQDSCTFTEMTRKAVSEATVGRVLDRLRQVFCAQFNAPGVSTELHLLSRCDVNLTVAEVGMVRYLLIRTGTTDIYCDLTVFGIVRLQGVPRT